VELGSVYANQSGLGFDIRQGQARQLATAQSRRIQKDDRDPCDRRQQGRIRCRYQLVCYDEQLRHLLRHNDHGPPVGEQAHKVKRVRDETVRVRTPTEAAELVYGQLPSPPCRRHQMAKGIAPEIEAGLIKIGAALARDEAKQVSEYPLCFDVTAPQRALVCQPSADPSGQRW